MSKIAQPKFGIGQPVSRKEDPRLITGRGRYTDDVDFPGQAYAVFLRSPVAHGVIRHLDVTEVEAFPGVLVVMTADDLARAGYGELENALPVEKQRTAARYSRRRGRLWPRTVSAISVKSWRWWSPRRKRPQRTLWSGSYSTSIPCPAVVDMEAALADDAVQVHPGHGNRCLDWRYGDTDAVDAAFAQAAHVSRIRLDNNRLVVASMEPRGAVAVFAAERYTLHASCQGAFGLRQGLPVCSMSSPIGSAC